MALIYIEIDVERDSNDGTRGMQAFRAGRSRPMRRCGRCPTTVSRWFGVFGK